METTRPTLPPQDPEPQARQSLIDVRKSERPYAYDNPRGVAAHGGIKAFPDPVDIIKNLPEGDRPSMAYLGLLGQTHAKIRQHFMTLPMKELNREGKGADERILAANPLTPTTGHRNINAVTAATPSGRPSSLEAYGALVDGLERVPLLDRIRQHPGDRDELFAYQRVAGPNPYILERVSDALPEKFPVQEAHFQRAMGTLRPIGSGGDTLARALAERRLFLVDCAALNGVKAEKNDGRQKYLAAAVGLFVRPIDGSAALLPVAIQCGQWAGTPIFTPGDGWRWRIAQAFLSSAEGSIHEAGEHLALTHLVVEAFALAARRNLHPAHPVAVLLEPHFEGTHLINFTARHNLIAQDGTLDRMMAPDVTITGEVAKLVLASYRVDQADPRSRLRARGLLDPAGLAVSPFREDALPLWDALHDWVRDYLVVYYPSDKAVADDPEVRRFVAELGAKDGGRLNGVPDVDTVVELVNVLTLAIFTGSVHHAAVNFTQYPFMGWVPNMPGALYSDCPTMETPDTEQAYLDALPPLDAAVLQMYSVWQLSAVRSNKLGEYKNLTDPAVADALAALRARLAAIEVDIAARQAARPLPYPYLLPSLLPASIII